VGGDHGTHEGVQWEIIAKRRQQYINPRYMRGRHHHLTPMIEAPSHNSSATVTAPPSAHANASKSGNTATAALLRRRNSISGGEETQLRGTQGVIDDFVMVNPSCDNPTDGEGRDFACKLDWGDVGDLLGNTWWRAGMGLYHAVSRGPSPSPGMRFWAGPCLRWRPGDVLFPAPLPTAHSRGGGGGERDSCRYHATSSPAAVPTTLAITPLPRCVVPPASPLVLMAGRRSAPVSTLGSWQKQLRINVKASASLLSFSEAAHPSD